jgi:hypothetical protein
MYITHKINIRRIIKIEAILRFLFLLTPSDIEEG